MPPDWAHHRDADAVPAPTLAAALTVVAPAHTKSTNAVRVPGGVKSRGVV